MAETLFQELRRDVGFASEDEQSLRTLHGVEFVLEDSGPGVSEPIRRRMFEPLMTTRPRGMGLGLPLVKLPLASCSPLDLP